MNNPPRTIVAISGGRIYRPCQTPETLAIDQEIVRLGRKLSLGRGRKIPNLLFIPTASDDDFEYCHGIYSVYEARLGCHFEHLRILAERLSFGQIREKIDVADIIYVGGGNTLRMMRAWKRRGVDSLLLGAYEQGKIMCGLSAGAICWFGWGCSDPAKNREKPVIRVSGLGLLPQAICPHWNSEPWRHEAFAEMLKKTGDIGLAIDDCCALKVVGNKMRLISSQLGFSARRLWWSRGKGRVLEEKPLCNDWHPYHFGLLPL
jgi:dipeptidase E